jgi:hypothetical protein
LIDWKLIHNQLTISQLAEQKCEEWAVRGPRLDDALQNGRLQMGYMDLVLLPLALRTTRSKVWLLEYDVDYSGHWATLFEQFRNNSADLLTTTVHSEAYDPSWAFWPTALHPANISSELKTRSFLPLCRVSRAFLHRYRDAVSTGEWRGHYEFLFPTIARAHRLSIEDIGGNGPFTPTERLNRNYENTGRGHLSPGTFAFRPSRSFYFHEKPDQFERANMLFHPIKPSVEEWQ